MEDGYPQLDKIATNFSRDGTLQPGWGTGAIPPSGAPDIVGAFRFLCTPSHLAYDDPVVLPGQPGRSHLHMFFGNTLADGNSTYASLRTTGASTCNNALNRSAYWVPALLDGRGNVVLPEYISIYYKRLPKTNPSCAQDICIGLPRGLRYVFGRSMSGIFDGPASERPYFNCDGPGAISAAYPTFAEAAKNCPSGASIAAIMAAPDCWNGRDLDSADHRSHVNYGYVDGWGTSRCPTTHPYRLPHFILQVFYKTDGTLDRSGNNSPDANTWYFSSDRMPGMPALSTGSTFHADWYGAWDDETMQTWLAHCVDRLLNCSGGELGDGTQMTFSPEARADYPRRVPVPADPKGS